MREINKRACNLCGFHSLGLARLVYGRCCVELDAWFEVTVATVIISFYPPLLFVLFCIGLLICLIMFIQMYYCFLQTEMSSVL